MSNVHAQRTMLRTTNIKGKEYVEVNTRIQYFRETPAYLGWSLTTEIVELTESRVVMKAIICDADGRVRATGLAYEKADSSYINKTSYIENCETSAWGRALGNLGIGISTSIASAEEVANAIAQQQPGKPNAEEQPQKQLITSKQVAELEDRLASVPSFDLETFAPWFERTFKLKYSNLGGLTLEQYEQLVNIIESKAKETQS